MTRSAAEQVLELLAARHETLATAESLTGGLLGELLTKVAGASAVYAGGVITYATGLKATLAGVDQATLDRDGPVALTTATQMAAGVAGRCGTDWGLATTGVAGPDPQDGHRVGQVFVAVSNPSSNLTHGTELALSGSRSAIRRNAADQALKLLIAVLGMKSDDLLVE